MSRREWFVNWARLAILRWRVVRHAPLPRFALGALVSLDRWAARLALQQRERAVGKPFDAEASRKIDRALSKLEGKR